MGIILEHKELRGIQSIYQLLIYSNSKIFPKIASDAIAMNKYLATELVSLDPDRRTMQLEECFVKVLGKLSEQPVIKDIDVMFNPAYKVDVMKILTSAYKKKPYRLIWPGSYSEGKLVYSEESYPDYRVYEVKNYDIMCVI